MRALLLVLAAACSTDDEMRMPDAAPEPTYDVSVELTITDSIVVVLDGMPVVSGDVVTFDFATATELVRFTATALVDFGDMKVEWPMQSVCQRDLKIPSAEHRRLTVRRGRELCDSIVESALCEYTDGTTAEWGYDPCE